MKRREKTKMIYCR